MATSSSVGSLSSPGVGSNLDVNGIVNKLMTVEQQPLNKLNSKEAGLQAKISAYGQLKSSLGTFQTAVQGLNDAGKFQSVSATPADTSVVTASATGAASAETYSLEISQLAQAQKLVAPGQISTTSNIGSGTITLDFGSINNGTLDSASGKYTGASFISNGNGVKTINIDPTKSSLTDIRNAINEANVGVTASIINDGSGSPYRLTLASAEPGANKSLKVTVDGDPALSNLLSHDPAGVQNLSETAAAKNAELAVNGVAVSANSNTLSDVIQGVTLNLLKTSSNTTLTVAQDKEAVKTSINSFVQAYNDLNTTLKSLAGYDADTKKGGTLQGDPTVLHLQSQIRALLGQPVANASGDLTTLSQIGVSFQRDGTLAADSTKLNSAITDHFDEIAGLFAETGKASDSLVNFASNTSKTKPGVYALEVSQLATRGSLLASAAPASTTIVAGLNDTLNISVNGIPARVTLAAGVYTPETLAAELQTKINGANSISSANLSVSVAQSGGAFEVTSDSYGSISSVAVLGGNGADNLFGVSSQTSGQDVEGTLNGSVAVGSGQKLTGIGDVDGLKVEVTGGALGYRGTVGLSKGYAHTLNSFVTTFLASGGPIDSRTNGVNTSITDIGHQRTALQSRLTTVEARYRAQFSQLDSMLSTMNRTSSYLTQQLSALQSLK